MNQKQFSKSSRFIAYMLVFAILSLNIVGIGALRNETKSILSPTLDIFTTDLTKLAQTGDLRVNQNYNTEVNALIKVLATDTLRQPVIIDDNGDSQTLVAELFASRLAKGDVPTSLQDKSLLKLDTAALFSDKRSEAEVSQIVERIFTEVSNSNGETILFINELTTFVGNSRVNDALTNLLQQGKVKIIGGSSTAVFGDKIESNAEVAAFFEKVNIKAFQANFEETNQPTREENQFRGDNVAPDLREMIQADATGGEKRIDLIIQSKNADNPVLQELLAQNQVKLSDRIGESNTIVVNLPLKAVEVLANSGLINYMSPDREIKRLALLTAENETEVFDFLSVRPVHTVVMKSFIQDNGLESADNRGKFYGYRNQKGSLEGVALIGHTTLIEARSDDSLIAFALAAKTSETPLHIMMADDNTTEKFWKFYAGDNRQPRLTCTELLFELNFPFLVQKCKWDVRTAKAEEIEQIAEAHAEVAFIESGNNPLEKDREGFLKRTLKRIEKKRTFVVFENGKLVFKADIVAETSDVIYLKGIYVAPEYRGQNVGSDCLAKLRLQLMDRVANICLLSNVEFKNAHRSFVKAGFKHTNSYQTIFV